jgi:hypothetical protein
MKIILIVSDGQDLRAFHTATMHGFEEEQIKYIAERLMNRAQSLTQLHPPLKALHPTKKPNGSLEAPQVTAEAFSIIGHTSMIPLKPLEPFEEQGHISKTEAPMLTQGEMARTAGYTGDVCILCHGFRLK